MPLTVALAAGFVGVGVFVGVGALIAYRHAWLVGGVTLPWGVVLCLATLYVVGRVAGLLGQNAGAFGYAGGWLAVFLATYQARPEGDYLIAADFRGYAYMFGGVGVLALVVGQTLAAPDRAGRGAPSTLER